MTVMQYVTDGLAVLGALYTLASVLGNVIPGKVGAALRKVALDLKEAEAAADGAAAAAKDISKL
jgi:hypothetical protein